MDLTRRRFVAALGGLILLPSLSGCLRPPPISIAAHLWPGYELLFFADRQKWIPRQKFILTETRSATESMSLLKQGAVDGAALTLDEVLRVRSEGIPLTVVMVFNISAGADAVLAAPGIRSPADLGGKSIGVEETALGALMLSKLLEAAGLKRGGVIPVPLPADRHLAAWKGGTLDAIITYEPTATLLEKNGARRIFDSRQIPSTIFDVLAIRSELASSRVNDLRLLTGAHFRSVDCLATNRQDLAYRLAGRLSISPTEVMDAFRNLELPGPEENRALLSGQAPHILHAARQLSGIMVAAGLLPGPDSLAGLASGDCLPTVEVTP